MKERLVTILLSAATTWGLIQAKPESPRVLEVDRLIVRDELIVSDTGEAWEQGFEEQQIPRGLYAKATADARTGLWVRGRLHKAELDDPFDDRFHAMNRDGTPFRAPGHISWNVWLDGAWRQLAIIQGEGLEPSEVPYESWSGGNHPGRLRFQSFRPHHEEPLTDATIGQGKMSIGGGGGEMQSFAVGTPEAPEALNDDGSGARRYALIAVGPQGKLSQSSPELKTAGRATLRWGSVTGGDAYIILRDGEPIAGPLRIEGSQKEWRDDVE